VQKAEEEEERNGRRREWVAKEKAWRSPEATTQGELSSFLFLAELIYFSDG